MEPMVMQGRAAADGWLGGEEEGIDLRRVVDVHHHRSIPQMMVNRGTVSGHGLVICIGFTYCCPLSPAP